MYTVGLLVGLVCFYTSSPATDILEDVSVCVCVLVWCVYALVYVFVVCV